MKKLCIFDLDGTVVNSLTTIAYYANLALGKIGLDPITEEKYRYYVGDGKKKLLHRILAHYAMDTDELFRKVEKIYDEHYEADTMYLTEAYDGIKELLYALKEKGIKIAICSNKPDNVVCDIAKILFGDMFDAVVGQREGIATKPAPDSANAIMKELGVKPGDALFIGDTNVDINTAKNAHIKSVGVLWGFRDEAELKEAGADVIVSHPSQILGHIE